MEILFSENRRYTMKKAIKITIAALLLSAVIGTASVFGINAYIKNSASDRIITAEEASRLDDMDCIIVLGCLVKDNGTPSDMLEDRLKRGVELYESGAAPKLLMSGDHGRKDYNEVGTMKQFALDAGVPSEDIFMDHAGFSTYESIYRAKYIFEAEKIIIVTQKYHLYRALYIAEQLGVEAYGVASDYRSYGGQAARDFREVLARCKDFVVTPLKPEPTYLGDVIPVNGNGDVTNDY